MLALYISDCASIVMNVSDNNGSNALFSPEWRMGSCYGPKQFLSDINNDLIPKYGSNQLHYDKCCLPPGTYTLICKNSESKYGWGNSKFEINGKRYCDDFVGFKAMRKVLIEGNQKEFCILHNFNLITS